MLLKIILEMCIRDSHEAELLEKCLQRESIPYVVAGREDFLRHDKVRGSVSYTHLDVYKRQLLSRSISPQPEKLSALNYLQRSSRIC